MSFDKTKAMRSAERYLSQGKIRAAIGEYRTIVDNDPKDFSTLNMLGDLYVKNKGKAEAVNCFLKVAEYYSKQGFSQKAIAVYNKISRLQPDSMDVSARLAELYQAKGSIAEARSHYVTLADQYQRGGKKMEALSIWKQIAELDPNNAEVYLKIAESYWQEKQKDEAAEAFTIAGTRLTAQGKHEAALTAFSRALEIRQHDFNALNGFVKAQINLGYADEAAKTLENILEQQPYNRDILYLLAECHLETGNPQAAECAVVKLVEQEPANYPKFLELVESYLKAGDLDSAARILSVSSEHLLVGGQADDYLNLTNEILARNPEHISGLRSLVRYYGWNRDEKELITSLERLAESARLAQCEDEEKNALVQLAMILPHETHYAERLRELNYDFSGSVLNQPNSENETVEAEAVAEEADFEPYQASGFEMLSSANEVVYSDAVSEFSSGFEIVGNSAGTNDADYANIVDSSFAVENIFVKSAIVENNAAFSAADEMRLEKEIDSIKFYIEQGYRELADKSLQDLEAEFGSHSAILELRQKAGNTENAANELAESSNFSPEISEYDFRETPPTASFGVVEFENVQAETIENADEADEKTAAGVSENKKAGLFADFRDGLDLEETETTADGDFETHFHLATAYSEMGLTEEAIREFQDAINLVSANDGSRKFFQCAHLLGNCFMERQMPHLALMWYHRALETANLNVEEQQGIWYEIARAHEADGDADKALENFEKIYAVDVDYRDVKDRVQSLLVNG